VLAGLNGFRAINKPPNLDATGKPVSLGSVRLSGPPKLIKAAQKRI
jgi:hypothetical protein